MRLRVVTAGAGAAWEAALAQACQQSGAPAEIVQRCYDLGDLLAGAAAGQAQVAIVASATRWLDREAVTRLGASGVAVVGVVPAGDEDAERRLRQLGIVHVARDADRPGELVELARAASRTEPRDDDPPTPAAPDGAPRRQHALVAVWGPKGAPGRSTVALNLAFEAAQLAGETLLVDADTYGGSIAQTTMQFSLGAC